MGAVPVTRAQAGPHDCSFGSEAERCSCGCA